MLQEMKLTSAFDKIAQVSFNLPEPPRKPKGLSPPASFCFRSVSPRKVLQICFYPNKSSLYHALFCSVEHVACMREQMQSGIACTRLRFG
jgi:hypothetical protein